MLQHHLTELGSPGPPVCHLTELSSPGPPVCEDAPLALSSTTAHTNSLLGHANELHGCATEHTSHNFNISHRSSPGGCVQHFSADSHTEPPFCDSHCNQALYASNTARRDADLSCCSTAAYNPVFKDRSHDELSHTNAIPTKQLPRMNLPGEPSCNTLDCNKLDHNELFYKNQSCSLHNKPPRVLLHGASQDSDSDPLQAKVSDDIPADGNQLDHCNKPPHITPLYTELSCSAHQYDVPSSGQPLQLHNEVQQWQVEGHKVT